MLKILILFPLGVKIIKEVPKSYAGQYILYIYITYTRLT